MISFSLGTTFLVASNVVGHGVGMGALLLAVAGPLFFALADSRLLRWREEFLRVLQLVLALGTFSVVAPVVGALQ